MALFGKAKEEPVVPEPVTTVTPDYVTKTEFSALDARIARMTEVMEQSMNRPIVVAAPAAPVVPEPDVSEADIDEAISKGEGAAPRIKQLIEQRIGKAKREMEVQLGTFQNYGTTMLGTLAERSFLSALDAEDRALFTRFEKEVRGLVGQCEVALAGHPETWETAFSTITGRHRRELKAEGVEASIRQRADEEQAKAALPGKDARPQASIDDAIPSIRELAGEFPHLGDLSEDEFIRKMNRGLPAKRRYKDWNDYVQRGRTIDAQLNAIHDGSDDGGEGAIPALLQ